MADNSRQDRLTDFVSRPLNATPRWSRGISREVRNFLLRRLAAVYDPELADDLILYCQRSTVRDTRQLPEWVRALPTTKRR